MSDLAVNIHKLWGNSRVIPKNEYQVRMNTRLVWRHNAQGEKELKVETCYTEMQEVLSGSTKIGETSDTLRGSREWSFFVVKFGSELFWKKNILFSTI